jgi:hypothetical protein
MLTMSEATQAKTKFTTHVSTWTQAIAIDVTACKPAHIFEATIAPFCDQCDALANFSLGQWSTEAQSSAPRSS